MASSAACRAPPGPPAPPPRTRRRRPVRAEVSRHGCGRRGALAGGSAWAWWAAASGPSTAAGDGGDVYASFVAEARRKGKVSAASFDLGEAAAELRGIEDELARQRNLGLAPRYRELRLSLRGGGLSGLRKALVAVAPDQRERGAALLEQLDAQLKDGERGGAVSVGQLQDGFAALAGLVADLEAATSVAIR